MFSADREQKTICALITGSGTAAVAVLRLSGPDAFKIIQKACPSLAKKKLESHKSYLAKFFDQKNNLIDQVKNGDFDYLINDEYEHASDYEKYAKAIQYIKSNF